MNGTYAQDWKPINFRGTCHYDPRDELRARAAEARDRHDEWVAIPIALAAACVDLRECGARTLLRADEDGPLSEPVEIQCRKPSGHDYDHFNGYCTWPNP